MKGHVAGGDDLQRRAAVLHAEVTATTQAIVTLTSWMTAPAYPCGHRAVTAGCGGCDQGAGWQLVDGRLVVAP